MDTKISIIRGTNDKPVASAELAQFFSNRQDVEGYLFLGYPIMGTPDGKQAIDAIWISPQKGIIIFDLIEGNDPKEFDIRQDDAANKLEAKLKSHRSLMNKRNLLIDINTISFAPGINNFSTYIKNGYEIANLDCIFEKINSIFWENTDQDIYNIALSAIQSMTTVRSGKAKRILKKENSKGWKLQQLENSIATLDSRQARAVIETVQGVQRIRGLAGSGKTIILALKAAYLHAQHPEWKIAVTFNTRSLKGQFRRLINNFSVEQTGEEPDWDKLKIINAWGAPGSIERSGIYYEFCKEHETDYYDYTNAKNKFGESKAFSSACEDSLSKIQMHKKLYDAILIDEAQDFPPAFLRLCYEILSEDKRLVYAYDELQSLSFESLPPPESIFGLDQNGLPRVEFRSDDKNKAKQDIILSKCYRNSRPVLVTAHALGFGIYRLPQKNDAIGLVQMFDYPDLWEEIGYKKVEGSLKEGERVILTRTEETSPLFLENHSPIDDLIQFISFENDEKQMEWITNEIKNNIDNDELRYDDIVVINPDPLTTRRRVAPIRQRLLEMGIQSHTAGVDTDQDIFFKPESESITFTGIYRAKGNEAGMIYIINAHDCNSSLWNLATIRNQLFTAITRSKAWVRVLGVGDGMQKLIAEFEQVKAEKFKLNFIYPTKKQREQLKIIHRDVSAEEKKRLDSHQKALAEAINAIDSGQLHLEDIDPELQDKLRKIINMTE